MNKKHVALAGTGVIAVIALLAVCFAPSVLYYLWGLRLREVDVKSGRIRERRYAFGFLVEERLSDTAFSKWASELSLVQSPPLWKRANAGAVGLPRFSQSAHISYTYGDAVASCHNLMLLHELEDADMTQRREDIAQFFRLMQEGKLREMERIVHNR